MATQLIIGVRKGLVFLISPIPDIEIILHDYDIDGLTDRPIFTDADGDDYAVYNITEGE
jgi:hypothetical protein